MTVTLAEMLEQRRISINKRYILWKRNNPDKVKAYIQRDRERQKKKLEDRLRKENKELATKKCKICGNRLQAKPRMSITKCSIRCTIIENHHGYYDEKGKFVLTKAGLNKI